MDNEIRDALLRLRTEMNWHDGKPVYKGIDETTQAIQRVRELAQSFIDQEGSNDKWIPIEGIGQLIFKALDGEQ